ncbi:Ger(x)C family spore germination protein [Paenibacillus sacheonensis]|uniref:Ger(X)C family spore germination protein n=1 Tax=Paenibacillus sacheonensis TaxID=742054 RepID=A0A7X5C1S1_9BACL|nr:Ger(x)C family spore germination protein [Paenibacillus sacheonensis]MBM7566388.1 spore germination protein KC [Paenibacillus sacheonensis]NBC70590.1 Ger(x)C family spore germination protein [Paenibacillus sacheonensis]
MRSNLPRLLTAILLLSLLTGCWDRRELNDRLFELASGVDRLEDGKLLLIGQFMVPSTSEEGGGAKKPYLIETGVGKMVSECLLDMQLKLSRRITRGHRNNIYFGEDMAKAGIADLMDSVTRDPDSRLKSDIWVVKGGTALEFMQLSYPLESIPAIGLSKIRHIIGKTTGNSLLEILVEENVEGSGPTLPAVEILYDTKLRKKTLQVYGRAIFNRDQQLAGYLNRMESVYRLWITGETDRIPITADLPNGRGSFNTEVTLLHAKTRTAVNAGRVAIDVYLTGSGVILESQPAIDLRKPDHLREFEDIMNRRIEKDQTEVIRKVQRQFKVDVFHFGKALDRQHPQDWARLKAHWEQSFSDAEVTVHSRVKIKRIGLQGPPPNKP